MSKKKQSNRFYNASYPITIYLMFVMLVTQKHYITAQRSMEGNLKSSTIYSFNDQSIRKNDDRLIRTWSRVWKSFGWNTVILSLDDAKNHLLFEEYNERLEKANVSWIEQQGFFRHLAMSTVKEGGLFSELSIFPLEEVNLNDGHRYFLQNEGNFTCYDASASLLSGNHEEWNRITSLLINNIEKNAIWSFWKMRHSDPTSIIRLFKMYNVGMDVSGKEFDTNICEPSFMVNFDLKNMKYPSSFILSWLKIRKARCFSNRPLMFTFFQPKHGFFSNGDRDLLEVWEDTWSEAGWEPVILNLDDVMRHPEFDSLLLKLLVDKIGTQFYEGKDKYNLYCFFRWVAMTVVGGGFMSDYDTFPLQSKPSLMLPNKGALSIYSNHVPNLVSGSAAEWNRISNVMFENYAENSNQGKQFWSDMREMEKLMMFGSNFTDIPLGSPETIPIHVLYDIFDDEDMEENQVINPYDVNEKCLFLLSFRAIHFSHHGCYLAHFCNGHKRRPLAARKWHNSWSNECK